MALQAAAAATAADEEEEAEEAEEEAEEAEDEDDEEEAEEVDGDDDEEEAEEVDGDDDDTRLVRLLDAVDRLLILRKNLARILSNGWIDLAAARYAMGPSRIDQSLFSLRPCSSSTLVSVTHRRLPDDRRGANENDPPLQFTFRIPERRNGDDASAAGDSTIRAEPLLEQSGLRHRHTQGTENYSAGLEDSKLSMKENASLITQEVQGEKLHGVNMKQRSEPLSWFGMLVSPHLRTAQSSFREGLDVIMELATIQSTIKSRIRRIKDRDLN